MLPFQSKLPACEESIFSRMSALAKSCDAINLSQGFPDFEVSPELIALVNDSMLNGFNQYAPMAGLLTLREAIAAKIKRIMDISVNPATEITITCGATEAIYATIVALVQPGDEVIVLEPAYDSYVPAILLQGATPKAVPLTDDFEIDFDALKAAVSPKTKMLIINTPHNPTGKVLDKASMLAIERFVLENDIFMLSDEVYEHLVFDGHQHFSALELDALRQQSIAVFSFGKTFHATGWKVGYSIAPEAISKEIRKVHQYLTFSTNTPVQAALATFLQEEKNYSNLPSLFEQKREFFSQYLEKSVFKPLPCEGTYFMLASYEGFSDKSDLAMAEWLTRFHGVASVPVSPFYQNKNDRKLLRFCFAKNQKTLAAAGERLCKI